MGLLAEYLGTEVTHQEMPPIGKHQDAIVFRKPYARKFIIVFDNKDSYALTPDVFVTWLNLNIKDKIRASLIADKIHNVFCCQVDLKTGLLTDLPWKDTEARLKEQDYI